MGITCDACLSGRHFGCTAKTTCGCTSCAKIKPKQLRIKVHKPRVHKPKVKQTKPAGTPGAKPWVWDKHGEEICRLRDAGMTWREIAQTLDVDTQAVRRNYLKRFPDSRRETPRKQMWFEHREIICRMRDEGATFQDISNVIGIPRSTISRAYNANRDSSPDAQPRG